MPVRAPAGEAALQLRDDRLGGEPVGAGVGVGQLQLERRADLQLPQPLARIARQPDPDQARAARGDEVDEGLRLGAIHFQLRRALSPVLAGAEP